MVMMGFYLQFRNQLSPTQNKNENTLAHNELNTTKIRGQRKKKQKQSNHVRYFVCHRTDIHWELSEITNMFILVVRSCSWYIWFLLVEDKL